MNTRQTPDTSRCGQNPKPDQNDPKQHAGRQQEWARECKAASKADADEEE